jgi:hypothetical protein
MTAGLQTTVQDDSIRSPLPIMPSTGSNHDGDERRLSQPKQPPHRWIKRYKTEVAASMSSVLSTASAFPLDSVKTRMQTYKYSGFLDCVRNTYQTEKLRGFFRGTEAQSSSH